MWRSSSKTRSFLSLRIPVAIIVAAILTMQSYAGAGLGDADPVLARYFHALQTGDVAELRSVLGGNLLERRRTLLANPMYPQDLIESFGTANFSVAGGSWRPSKELSVDVVVALDADESVKWRLTLQRDPVKSDMRIVELNTIAE